MDSLFLAALTLFSPRESFAAIRRGRWLPSSSLDWRRCLFAPWASNKMTPDERIVFVDIESIGLDPAGPIRQIAAIAVDADLRELETFEATLTIDWADVRRWRRDGRRKAPRSADEAAAAQQFAGFLARHATADLPLAGGPTLRVAQLAAHYAAHDGPYLQAFFARNGRFYPGHFRMLCTVQRALWLFHENKSLTPPPDFKLLTLCRYFGVTLQISDAHDALHDIRATVALYRAILGLCHSATSAATLRFAEFDLPIR